MNERRYGEDEVREIFSLATTSDPRDRSQLAESGGMTLEELQRIGEESASSRRESHKRPRNLTHARS